MIVDYLGGITSSVFSHHDYVVTAYNDISSCVMDAGSDGGTPSVDLPVGTTSKQLELLINSLLANQESVRVRSHAFVDNKFVSFVPVEFNCLHHKRILSTWMEE
jgi:hypothetical protein